MREETDMGGMMGYSRLCFGAAYPWDAFRGQGQESQMYVLAPQNTEISCCTPVIGKGYYIAASILTLQQV